MINVDRLRASIMQHEGYSQTPYQDHLGHWTIGFGHLIDWITDKQLHEHWLDEDVQAAIKMARGFCGHKWDILEPARVEVICEMAFQLGSRLWHFERMRAALLDGNFASVVTEMLDSKWARQTPKRAQTLADRFAHG